MGFLQYGVLGSVCVLLIFFLGVLARAYSKQVDRNHQMAITMMELATKLTQLVEDTYSATKEMPAKLQEKIKPDLQAIKNTVDDIKTEVKK